MERVIDAGPTFPETRSHEHLLEIPPPLAVHAERRELRLIREQEAPRLVGTKSMLAIHEYHAAIGRLRNNPIG
jgi:hypothetical protein